MNALTQKTLDELHDSFEHLRREARSWEDVRDWFQAHPEQLTQGVTLAPNSTIQVEVGATIDMCLNACDNQGLRVDISLESWIPFEPNPLFGETLKQRAAMHVVNFKHTSNVLLPLETWPIAAAAVAAAVLNSPSVNTDWHRELTTYVDKALAVHFPGMSTTKILDIASAGLMPLTKRNKPDRTSVMKMLFATRQQASPEVPFDMV